jgi:SAM-dependent methyltransferase
MSQGDHYDTILADYEAHYYDPHSMAYRRRYIYQPMFHGLDLNGKRVAELACGSGHNTREMISRFPEATVFGLDISPKSCAAYQRNTGRDCFVCDLTAPGAALPEPADVAVIVGGLHHCVNDLPSALRNLSRLVRPGGLALMAEPNALYFLNRIRQIWYRKDKWFHEHEEEPLDASALLELAGGDFEQEELRYLGGPAYFLILNSLVTRIPARVKSLLAPALFRADDAYNRLPGAKPYPMFIARWKRTTR